eukprot:COSAG01_NODE_3072_length_6637_cov_10.406087_5_plen_173_part_00
MLFELDTRHSGAGWRTHAFPARRLMTGGPVPPPEVGGAMARAGGSLFLIDGGDLESYETGGNWRFELESRRWFRLAGSSVRQLSGFHNHNNAIFQGRYMILIGGCQVWNWLKGKAPQGREQCYIGSPGFGTCGCPCSKSSNGTLDIRNVSCIMPGTCGVPRNDSSIPMVYVA